MLPLEEAQELSSEFVAKSWIVWHHVVMHFVHCHSIVYRLGTHVVQKSKEEVVRESVDFMNLLWPKLQRLDIDMAHVFNMDQTAIFYLMHTNKTIEAR